MMKMGLNHRLIYLASLQRMRELLPRQSERESLPVTRTVWIQRRFGSTSYCAGSSIAHGPMAFRPQELMCVSPAAVQLKLEGGISVSVQRRTFVHCARALISADLHDLQYTEAIPTGGWSRAPLSPTNTSR